MYISYNFQRSKLRPVTVGYETCHKKYSLSCFTQHRHLRANNHGIKK